ncbi:AAA family ATPase [Vagococcus silagei]|uniref:AAA family ATPase n=1 Tax=Vagococcus silagei TaxID=2508885 RepID=UPI00194FE85A|nr:AAA family ATPase [Vagococcus silagei]
MIIIITGGTHTGKTTLAQSLLTSLHYSYLSQDHLKMGLIRSNQTTLTVEDDDALVDYLWPITCEIIKTAIENKQNLIVEGCYIPFNWQNSFDATYLESILFECLVMTEDYIKTSFETIKDEANRVEMRLDDSQLSLENMIKENHANMQACQTNQLSMTLIQSDYEYELRQLHDKIRGRIKDDYLD